jgi:hypothetical protein
MWFRYCLLIVEWEEIGYNIENSIGRKLSNEKSITNQSGKL